MNSYIKAALLFFLFIAHTISICGQNSNFIHIKDASPKLYEKFKKARKLAHNKNTEKAYKIYSSIAKKCPKCIEPYVKMGTIHYQNGAYEKAIEKFEKVLQLDPEFNPKLHYTLGLAYWKIRYYEKASNTLDRYIKRGEKGSSLMSKAILKKNHADFALNHPLDPSLNKPELLTASINTDKNESFPMTTADANTLIYTARVNRREYLFQVNKKGEYWSVPHQLNIAGNQIESGAHTISPDGKIIIFTSCSKTMGYGSCDLYESKKINENWSTPKNLGNQINTASWEGHPSLGNNGQVLYFSSSRKGSLGKKDIWVSKKDKRGLWSKPTNLGKNINTKYNEQAPYIHHDNNTLYFASDGHPGMGDMDLFIARKKENNDWSTPINLGQPINSRVQEGCMSVSLDGKEGFLVSDRKYEEQVLKDDYNGAEINIYKFKLHKDIAPSPVTYVIVSFFDKSNNVLPFVNISINEINENISFYKGRTDNEGKILLVLPANKSYAFTADKESYVFHSENFNLIDNNGILNPFKIDIILNKVPKQDEEKEGKTEAVIILKNVFFKTGKHELIETSYYELNHLVSLLRNNTSLNIQINGHTDNVGDEIANKELSHKRAKSVYDYLIHKNINPSRLTYRGFGEDQPIDSNKTQIGRKNNRRTEFKIIR